MRTSFDDVFQPVDHTSSIPLYLQIVFQMDSALRAGRLPQDTLLPSEPELCAGFDVSRSTLRRAMGKLEDRGIVTRERGRGKGTRIVSTAPITRTPGSFTTMFNQIAAARRRPRTRVLTFERLVVDEALANLTGFPVNTSIVHVLRHRSANDVPVAVLENWILSDYISFDPVRLEDESMDVLLREGGARIHHAEFEFQPTLAGEHGEFFCIDPAAPVIKEIRHVFNDRWQYEYAEAHSHPRNERLRGVASP